MNNRSSKYLSRQYMLRCDRFKTIYENLPKLGHYIADSSYYELKNITEVKDYLFIVVDSLGHFNKTKKRYEKNKEEANTDYKNVIKQLETFPYFVDHYKLSRQEDHKRVLIFEIAPNLDGRNRVELFLNGKYSEIWDKNELDILFPDIENPQMDYLKDLAEKRAEIKGILSKKEEFKQMFVDLLKIKYGTTIRVSDISNDSELDLPAKTEIQHEIIGSENWLYLVGQKKLESPPTVTSEDLV